jgi:hypothetical protein
VLEPKECAVIETTTGAGRKGRHTPPVEGLRPHNSHDVACGIKQGVAVLKLIEDQERVRGASPRDHTARRELARTLACTPD